MLIFERLLTFIFSMGIILLLVSGCGPKPDSRTNTAPPATSDTPETNYNEVTAKPTLVVPKSEGPNAKNYQLPPKKILNNDKTEIILGEAELINPKVSYNSNTRQMNVTGRVKMLNDIKEKMDEKEFSLTGTHEKDQSIFILKDEDESVMERKLLVRAQANCFNTEENPEVNCNHVVVDIYIYYNNKYYTEQIEVNRNIPKKMTPPAAPAPKINPAEPIVTQPFKEASEIPVQHEDEDQLDYQQPEDHDDSIDGRYQGNAQSINLDLLFSQEDATPVAQKIVEQPAPPPAKKKSEDATPAKPPQKPLEKIIAPDTKQTEKGVIRPINQALGFPDAGKLRNATSVYSLQNSAIKKAFFEIVLPEKKRYFATYEMAEMLTKIGEVLNKNYHKTLYVSSLSAVNGGHISPHASHQNGLDADLAYPTDKENLKFPLVVKMKSREYYPDNYSLEKTYNLFKFLFSQKEIPVDRIFVDQKIINSLCKFAAAKNEFATENRNQIQEMFENIQHVEGHGDHFHLRIKCSKSDPGCRGRIYRKMDNCKGA